MNPWFLAAMASVLGWMVGCGGASRPSAPEPTTPVPTPLLSESSPASALALPSASRVCEGLLPARVEPRSLDIQTGIFSDCADGSLAVDDAGTLTYASGDASLSRYHWSVVAPDGAQRSVVLATRYPPPALWPQVTGFQMVIPICHSGDTGVDFSVLEATGKVSQARSIGGSFNFDCEGDEYDSAPDPLGGTVVAWFRKPRTTGAGAPQDSSFQVRLQRFDATGQPRFAEVSVASWSPTPTELNAIVVGTDTRGHTLVLWKADRLFGAGTVAGRWLDADGAFLTPVFRARVPALRPDAQTQVLTPLYGGGLVLQVNGAWTHAFASGDARVSAPPDWLARRQGRLERVRGGKAYALLPPAPSSPVREQRVEVLAPDGTSCGQLTFASELPAREALRLGGEDGIFQQQPLAHPSNEDVQGCTLTRWPEVLR